MVMWAGLLYTTFVEVYKIASVSMISCQWAYFWGLRTEKVFGGRLEERGSWSILWLWAHVVLLFRVFLFRGHLESFRRFLDSFVCLFLSSFIFFGAHTFFFTEFTKQVTNEIFDFCRARKTLIKFLFGTISVSIFLVWNKLVLVLYSPI